MGSEFSTHARAEEGEDSSKTSSSLTGIADICLVRFSYPIQLLVLNPAHLTGQLNH